MQHTDPDKNIPETDANNAPGINLRKHGKTLIVCAVIVVAAIALRACGG